ncbi:hypothetical protein ADUPG1_013766, partial [Aduncisulcus paluster]
METSSSGGTMSEIGSQSSSRKSGNSSTSSVGGGSKSISNKFLQGFFLLKLNNCFPPILFPLLILFQSLQFDGLILSALSSQNEILRSISDSIGKIFLFGLDESDKPSEYFIQAQNMTSKFGLWLIKILATICFVSPYVSFIPLIWVLTRITSASLVSDFSSYDTTIQVMIIIGGILGCILFGVEQSILSLYFFDPQMKPMPSHHRSHARDDIYLFFFRVAVGVVVWNLPSYPTIMASIVFLLVSIMLCIQIGYVSFYSSTMNIIHSACIGKTFVFCLVFSMYIVNANDDIFKWALMLCIPIGAVFGGLLCFFRLYVSQHKVHKLIKEFSSFFKEGFLEGDLFEQLQKKHHARKKAILDKQHRRKQQPTHKLTKKEKLKMKLKKEGHSHKAPDNHRHNAKGTSATSSSSSFSHQHAEKTTTSATTTTGSSSKTVASFSSSSAAGVHPNTSSQHSHSTPASSLPMPKTPTEDPYSLKMTVQSPVSPGAISVSSAPTATPAGSKLSLAGGSNSLFAIEQSKAANLIDNNPMRSVNTEKKNHPGAISVSSAPTATPAGSKLSLAGGSNSLFAIEQSKAANLIDNNPMRSVNTEKKNQYFKKLNARSVAQKRLDALMEKVYRVIAARCALKDVKNNVSLSKIKTFLTEEAHVKWGFVNDVEISLRPLLLHLRALDKLYNPFNATPGQLYSRSLVIDVINSLFDVSFLSVGVDNSRIMSLFTMFLYSYKQDKLLYILRKARLSHDLSADCQSVVFCANQLFQKEQVDNSVTIKHSTSIRKVRRLIQQGIIQLRSLWKVFVKNAAERENIDLTKKHDAFLNHDTDEEDEASTSSNSSTSSKLSSRSSASASARSNFTAGSKSEAHASSMSNSMLLEYSSKHSRNGFI